MERLETTGYYALGIPLIGAVLAYEVWKARDSVSFAEAISNLSAGLGTLIVGIFVGPWIYAMWDWAYQAFGLVDWGQAWFRWPVALLLSDLCYYTHHRAGHRFAFLWAIHGVHHQHEHLNSTVGLRLEWLADLSTIVFFSAMPLLGFDPFTGFVTVSLLSAYTLTTHAPALSIPGFGVLVNAASHGAHHSRDARYSGYNFGAMFTFWDRLFGTYRPHDLSQPLKKDVPTVSRMHDGVAAQWSLMAELFEDVRTAKGWRERIYLLVRRPGQDGRDGLVVPRDETSLTAGAKTYLLCDFVCVVAFSTWLLWFRGDTGLPLRLAAAAWAIWSLRAIGGLLDGRDGAVRESNVRWVAALALAAGLAPNAAVVSICLAIAAMLGLASLKTVRGEFSQSPATA
ncbi:MAG: sterol desaturase family protein [Elusimicrobia bacterium]|nr:sterol desaturase family protein [Elusimicrobiota bacterium]